MLTNKQLAREEAKHNALAGVAAPQPPPATHEKPAPKQKKKR
jgi:hypothetical protein